MSDSAPGHRVATVSALANRYRVESSADARATSSEEVDLAADFDVVAKLASVTADFFVLAIGRALRLVLVPAIIAQLALVLRYLGAIAGCGGAIASPKVAVEGLLVLGKLALVVADFVRLAPGLCLRLTFVLPIVVNGGPIPTNLARLLGHGGGPLLVRAADDRGQSDEHQGRQRKGSKAKGRGSHGNVLSGAFEHLGLVKAIVVPSRISAGAVVRAAAWSVGSNQARFTREPAPA